MHFSNTHNKRILTVTLLSTLLISTLAGILLFQNVARSICAEENPVSSNDTVIEGDTGKSAAEQVSENQIDNEDKAPSASAIETKIESSGATETDMNVSTPTAEDASQYYLSEYYFSDHFEGTTVDSEKWIVQENTDMSGHPAYGGTVTVADSHISLSSEGSGFPCVTSAVNPFPTSGDFSIEFSFTYTCISDWGNGLWISKGPFIATEEPRSATIIFQLWADNDGYDIVSIRAALFGRLIYFSEISGWEPSAPTHIFRLEYRDGVYTVFINSGEDSGAVEVTSSASSQIRPDTIGFGHPPAYYLPYSPPHVSSVIGGWGSLAIDYIRVTSHAETADEETKISVFGSSLFFAESNSTLSSLAFNLTSREIYVTVSDPSETGGYVRFLISKTLMESVAYWRVYLNGRQIGFTAKLNGEFHELYCEY